MDHNAIYEAKVLAEALGGHWLTKHGRRIMYMFFELFGYLLALALLILDLWLIGLGHQFLLAEAVDGHQRATAYVEDDRITFALRVGYLLIFLLALSSFLLARMIRNARKRRQQIHRLCEVVKGL
ncbi:MAG: hypothetical protein JNL05_10110 [Flavobacteriales bacterium]|nr:hypothetical protein [Flavobacteriales bacterium]